MNVFQQTSFCLSAFFLLAVSFTQLTLGSFLPALGFSSSLKSEISDLAGPSLQQIALYATKDCKK